MNQSIRFWTEYLNQYCMVEGLTGLTVPNIVGSVRVNTSLKTYSINEFLDELVNEKFEVLITYCPDMEELVFGNFKPWNAYRDYYECLGSIYFDSKDFQALVSNLNDLKAQLISRYGNRIKNETYSKVYQTDKWVYLTDEDNYRHSVVNNNLKFK